MKTALHDIDALISKFFAGEASPEEAMLLEDWKAESEENASYFDRSMLALGFAEPVVSTDAAWMNVLPQLKTEAPIRKLGAGRWILPAAAVLTVLLSIGFIWMYLIPETSPQQVYTAQQTEKNVRLEDGTGIVIAANSSVELAPGYGKNNRTVRLKGSGYFTVKHSDRLPFVIDAGPIHIKDLGTKFDVQNAGDTIFVRVDEGQVMIYDNKGMKITLNANESAHYVISTGQLQMDVETSGGSAKPKTIIFDQQRLEDVVQLLNDAYKADIRIQSPQARNCIITIEFHNEDLDMALTVIAQTLGLTLEKQGTTYWLKGHTCN